MSSVTCLSRDVFLRTIHADFAPSSETLKICFWNNKEIDGSPFQVVVKIPPTQLGQPVRKIEGLKCPWGIAINNKQQLVVAENERFGSGGKITIMDRDGNKLHTEWKKIQTVQCSKFKYPHGVAAGSDRALYVTDIGAKCLFKFNKERKTSQLFEMSYMNHTL